MRNAKGFTLIELAIVISIIAIMAVTVSDMLKNGAKARRETAPAAVSVQ